MGLPYPGKLPEKHVCFDKFRIFSKIFVAKLRFFLTNHGKQYILLGYGKKSIVPRSTLGINTAAFGDALNKNPGSTIQ